MHQVRSAISCRRFLSPGLPSDMPDAPDPPPIALSLSASTRDPGRRPLLAPRLAFASMDQWSMSGLPALAVDLHASLSNLPWAINAYLLPLGALMLFAGGMGDHFGRRRLFLAGLVIFTLASILCAASTSFSSLLAARAVQGLGAALLMPNSLALLGSEFEGEARGRAIGTWAAVGALAGALGPITGGWLIDRVGWRTIFLVNVPLAIAAGFLAWKYVAERRDSRAGPLDSVGAGLSTVGLGLLIWSLTESSGTTTPARFLWIAALAGTAILAGFLWHEGRLRNGALMPLAMFAHRTFAGLNLLTFFLYGSLRGLYCSPAILSDSDRALVRRCRRRCVDADTHRHHSGLALHGQGRVETGRTSAAGGRMRIGRARSGAIDPGRGRRNQLLDGCAAADAPDSARHGSLRRSSRTAGVIESVLRRPRRYCLRHQ